ncbi:MAG: ABC transporter permease, partial [Oscillospiraceae bacterium]|nr:ABC transporter permease [Oscillospiraceae bacterium]
MWSCIKNGLKNIFRKKIRSSLTVTGVAIGVTSVLIISSIGDIGKHTVNQELESVGMGGLS